MRREELVASIENRLASRAFANDASGSKGRVKHDFLYLLGVLVLSLLSFLPWLGSYGLLDPTDSFFLESGREAVETGQYLLPLNNYQPWLDKPILFFWMLAASYKLFGLSPFVGRLPAALSAVACALIIYLACRPLLRRRAAAVAALIFVANPLSSIIGHVCLTDMTLTALIAGSILFLFKGLEYQSRKNLLTAYVFMALAFLCKGPIALVILAISFLPYLISLSKNRQDFLSKLFSLKPAIGLAILFAVNLPWYLAAGLATNGQFLVSFFYTQNFGRMVGTVNHQGPFYFYIPVFFGGFFPWCLFSLASPPFFKRAISGAVKKGSSSDALSPDVQSSAPRVRKLFRLCLLWFGAVILMFSLIKTKLPTYILPAMPAFAILVAIQFELLAKSGKLSRLLIPTAVMSLALIVAAFLPPFLKPGYVQDIFKQNYWVFFALLPFLAASWLALYLKKSKIYLAATLAMALFSCGLLVPAGLRAFYQARQLGFSQLVLQARDAKASIAMVFAEEPSVVWITHKAVSRLSSREDAAAFLANTPKPHYVLVQTSSLPRLDWFKVKMTGSGQNGKWHLFKCEE